MFNRHFSRTALITTVTLTWISAQNLLTSSPSVDSSYFRSQLPITEKGNLHGISAGVEVLVERDYDYQINQGVGATISYQVTHNNRVKFHSGVHLSSIKSEAFFDDIELRERTLGLPQVVSIRLGKSKKHNDFSLFWGVSAEPQFISQEFIPKTVVKTDSLTITYTTGKIEKSQSRDFKLSFLPQLVWYGRSGAFSITCTPEFGRRFLDNSRHAAISVSGEFFMNKQG